MVEITQADIVERLRALHVWPQSTADTYPDTLGPRRIKALYEIGGVAHEAADRIEALEAEIERLRERVKRVENNNRELRGSKERVYAATDLRAALDARGLEIREKN